MDTDDHSAVRASSRNPAHTNITSISQKEKHLSGHENFRHANIGSIHFY